MPSLANARGWSHGVLESWSDGMGDGHGFAAAVLQRSSTPILHSGVDKRELARIIHGRQRPKGESFREKAMGLWLEADF
jgi:hypothetical protein